MWVRVVSKAEPWQVPKGLDRDLDQLTTDNPQFAEVALEVRDKLAPLVGAPTTLAIRSSLMLFWSETTKPPGARYWLIIVVAQTVSYDFVQTKAISTGSLNRLWTSWRWSAFGCTRYSPWVPSSLSPSRLIVSMWSGHGSISVTSAPARERWPPT